MLRELYPQIIIIIMPTHRTPTGKAGEGEARGENIHSGFQWEPRSGGTWLLLLLPGPLSGQAEMQRLFASWVHPS